MIKAIKNCFVEERVNLGRQKELDIAKGIAIIFMVLCHGFEILSWFFDSDGKFVKFLYVLTEPAIMPIRKLLEKLNWFQGLPIDMSFFVTYLILTVLLLVLA